MKTLIALLLLTAVGCEILEEDISGRQVQVLAPADRAVVPVGAVDFHWRALQYASGYEFTLASPSFENPLLIVADTVIYADSLDRGFRFRAELAGGDYQWSVTAFNGGYTSRAEVRSLKVEAAE